MVLMNIYLITQSIQLAEADLQDARMFVNKGDVEDAGINRSPYSYDQNPAEERARYPHNVDKEMTLLKVTDAENAGLGALRFVFYPIAKTHTFILLSCLSLTICRRQEETHHSQSVL